MLWLTSPRVDNRMKNETKHNYAKKWKSYSNLATWLHLYDSVSVVVSDSFFSSCSFSLYISAIWVNPPHCRKT